jgi:type VII secretion-associated serine protease mycosin
MSRRSRVLPVSLAVALGLATIAVPPVAVAAWSLTEPAAGTSARHPAIAAFAVVHAHGRVTVLRASSAAGLDAKVARARGTVVVSGVDHAVRLPADVTAQPAATVARPDTLDDPYASKQWALSNSSFTQVWPTTIGTGVVVAVLDTGVLATHEDLIGSVLAGRDFVGDGVSPDTDPNGHGTHVAGIIAAHANNDLGMAGAAPGVKILPVRVLDAHGAGTLSALAAGIVWASDNGASVISISLGTTVNDPAIADAVDYSGSHGVVIVAAAGNDGNTSNSLEYPAADRGVVSVGAVDATLTAAAFSNTSDTVALSAPGVDIVSTWGTAPDAYRFESGTSMAAPYVAAAVALVRAARPALTPPEVVGLLETTAYDRGPHGLDAAYGFGYVDPAAALAIADRPASVPDPHGYWVAYSNGVVKAFGGAPFLGDSRASATMRRAPIVAMALRMIPTGYRQAPKFGYWLVNARGAVAAFGTARNYGSVRATDLHKPITGMAVTADGLGYWLVAADSGVFAFGDAPFMGSGVAEPSNRALTFVDISATPSGDGYFVMSTTGAQILIGDAWQWYLDNTGDRKLPAPIASMSLTADGNGSWLIGRDGHLYPFGTAAAHGSRPIALTPGGLTFRRVRAGVRGYYVLRSDGEIEGYGGAPNAGWSLTNPKRNTAVDLATTVPHPGAITGNPPNALPPL